MRKTRIILTIGIIICVLGTILIPSGWAFSAYHEKNDTVYKFHGPSEELSQYLRQFGSTNFHHEIKRNLIKSKQYFFYGWKANKTKYSIAQNIQHPLYFSAILMSFFLALSIYKPRRGGSN